MKSWSSGSWKTSPTRARTVAQRARAHLQPGHAQRALAAQQAVEVQHQRGLPGAVGSQDGDALAVADPQVDPSNAKRPSG
jgi:hypothetical protein